jgi:PAS domain-containing protein
VAATLATVGREKYRNAARGRAYNIINKLSSLEMNASNNIAILSSSPNSREGNDSTRMMFDKSFEGSMDDLYGNESLDALLDSESLNDDVSNPLPNGVAVADSMGLGMSHLAAHVMQPMLTTASASAMMTSAPNAPGSNMMYGQLPSIPYSISTTNQPSGASSLPSFASPPYSQTMQRPIAPVNTSLTSDQHQSIAPSPALAYSTNTAMYPPNTNEQGTGLKRTLDATEVSDDEGDTKVRKQGRNLREQQRSQKITQQIDILKEVLASSNISFKPDKYSTLVTVAEYIKQLQAKSAALDEDHKKLSTTISKTNEMIDGQYVPASTDGKDIPGGVDLGEVTTNTDAFDGVFVTNIDYKSVFGSCGVPLAVASIDGRFLDCNAEFLKLIDYSREELLPCQQLSVIAEETPSSAGVAAPQHAAAQASDRNLSLFNLLNRDHMEGVFLAMSQMLKKPLKNAIARPKSPEEDCWAGDVYLGRLPDTKMRMNVSLVRSPQGRAKFFDCSLFPIPNP